LKEKEVIMPVVKIIIDIVNEEQVSFGALLGLDIKGDTITVAHAKFYDYIDSRFGSQKDEKELTRRQIEFASEFGFDISKYSKRVGETVINDILYSLDVESIKKQNLKPYTLVYNRHDTSSERLVISSIKMETGIVYFKGGCGRYAFARNLININE
jgi:hypothetical protein